MVVVDYCIYVEFHFYHMRRRGGSRGSLVFVLHFF
jgi:hypothetical protein